MNIDIQEGAAMNPGGKSAALGQGGVSLKEFEKIVADAFALVPEKFTAKVKNMALLIEDEPSLETLRENNIGEGHTLLGLYRGIPKTERGDSYGVGATLPDTITIFKNPIIQKAAEDSGVGELLEWGELPTEPMKKHIRTIVRNTIWHEIAHHFGMDEFEIGEREEAGTNEFK
jgi:predicted Zn-dependent protease with MMP-like domain